MKFKMIRKWKFFILNKIFLALLLLCFTLLAFADRFSHLELFAQTLNLIKINYFKSVKMETLIYGAIKGLLREIDPHSHFLLPKDFENLKEEAKGQFYSLGIEVENKEDFLIVISVVQNSPAQKAGFQRGDRILKIDDKTTKNFTVDEFRLLTRNRVGNIQAIITLLFATLAVIACTGIIS